MQTAIDMRNKNRKVNAIGGEERTCMNTDVVYAKYGVFTIGIRKTFCYHNAYLFHLLTTFNYHSPPITYSLVHPATYSFTYPITYNSFNHLWPLSGNL